MRRALTAVVLATLILAPCAHAGVATDEMTFCSNLGPKHPGSDADLTEAGRVADRFRQAGLDTSLEAFHMPVYEPISASVEVLGDQPQRLTAESFAYGGNGTVEAPAVYAGGGAASDFAGLDVKGKIVVVDGSLTHRTVQVRQILARGGVGMVQASGAPNNQIATGAVIWGYKQPIPFPTLVIGGQDGAKLRDRIEAGPVRLRIAAQGRRVDKVTHNVIGVRKGTTYPDRYVVVAGHYDSWYSGAVDNCTAVGTLLATALSTRFDAPAYTTIFIGWGAEETGLMGSSAWVARHADLIPRIVTNINLEMTAPAVHAPDGTSPSSSSPQLGGSASSTAPGLLAAILAGDTSSLTPPVLIPMTVYRAASGGIIATDLENFYGQGVQGFSTASSTPYYHTTSDVAATVDAAALERSGRMITDTLRNLQAQPPALLTLREVPRLKLVAPPAADAGAAVPVELKLSDPLGVPITGMRIEMIADQRDTWAVAQGSAEEVGGGVYRWTVPAGTTDADLTTIRARAEDTGYVAVDFATVDQRGGGVVAAGSSCVSRRVITLTIRRSRGARVSISSTRGKVRLLAGRTKARLDLRGVTVRGEVVVRVRVAPRRGTARVQTRRFHVCAARPR